MSRISVGETVIPDTEIDRLHIHPVLLAVQTKRDASIANDGSAWPSNY